MQQDNSPVSDVARRYASSLHELAVDEGSADRVENDLKGFEQLLAESDDFRRLVHSPAFSSQTQADAMKAIVAKADVAPLTGNFLQVVARNRRLFALPGIITAYKRIAADARGEVTAYVTSAHELTDEHRSELKVTLKDIAKKDVTLDVTVDPSILGGLVVRLGSRQIDTSLKTKLNKMKLALKEVG